MSKYDLFPGYIGQDKLKNKLSFLLNTHRTTKIFDPILLVSSRGTGKSTLARQIGDNLLTFDNSRPRKFIEINCASVNKIGDLVDEVIKPHVDGNQEVTVFLDEFGQMNKRVENWMLTVLCPNKENLTTAYFDGRKYDFNFKYVSFILATTDARLLSLPMKSRLRRLEFEPYLQKDLIQIINQNLKDIEFRDNIQYPITDILRGSPRIAVMMAKDIRQYLENKGSKVFDNGDWQRLKHLLDLLPLGISRNEYQLLKFLKEKPMSLTALSARFGLDAPELRREIEIYPLCSDLIYIDGKRKITQKGLDLLKTIEN